MLYLSRHLPDDYAVLKSPPTGRLCFTYTCVATYQTTKLNLYMCRHLPDDYALLIHVSPPTGRLCLTCTCVATYRATMLYLYMCRHLSHDYALLIHVSPPIARLCLTCTCVATYRTTEGEAEDEEDDRNGENDEGLPRSEEWVLIHYSRQHRLQHGELKCN